MHRLRISEDVFARGVYVAKSLRPIEMIRLPYYSFISLDVVSLVWHVAWSSWSYSSDLTLLLSSGVDQLMIVRREMTKLPKFIITTSGGAFTKKLSL